MDTAGCETNGKCDTDVRDSKLQNKVKALHINVITAEVNLILRATWAQRSNLAITGDSHTKHGVKNVNRRERPFYKSILAAKDVGRTKISFIRTSRPELTRISENWSSFADFHHWPHGTKISPPAAILDCGPRGNEVEYVVQAQTLQQRIPPMRTVRPSCGILGAWRARLLKGNGSRWQWLLV